MNSNKFDIKILDEPLLEFGFKQTLSDPHNGLATFGPYDIKENSHPKSMSYAVISTRTGQNLFERFLEHLKHPINVSSKVQNKMIWPMFPGFESVFGTELPDGASCVLNLEQEKLITACKQGDRFKRISEVVGVYLEQIRKVAKLDEHFDIIYCIVPDLISKSCRPKSIVRGAIGKNPSKTEIYNRINQLSLFQNFDSDYYMYAPDFRRQIKARTMEFGIPIQILLESTLAIGEEEEKEVWLKSKRGLTPLSDRAWNISTATYYKVGGKPWKLANVRDGVCYIGLSFKMIQNYIGNNSACCAAQMFLQDGDGVVFKSDEGVFHSPKDKTMHLSKEGAKRLLEGVLKEYETLGGKPLKEIFIHCSSEFSKDEFEGFNEVCPTGAKVIAVRVKRDLFFRLFRNGNRPVVRGSYLKINNDEAYLWSSGFKYELGTYDGTEIPIPLRITIQYGNADIETVSKDIFALSKLNYNACRFGESSPVTIGFSGAVGEILISNPKSIPRPQFKFYI